MSDFKEQTNKDLDASDILGADVNQSLFHLVGYVWAEGNQNRVFPTEKFSELIQFVFDQHKSEITQLQKDLEKDLEKAVKCLERIDKVYFDDGEARACLEDLRGKGE